MLSYYYDEIQIDSLSNKQFSIVSDEFIVYIKVFELIPQQQQQQEEDNNNVSYKPQKRLEINEYIYKIELYFQSNNNDNFYDVQQTFYDKLIFKNKSKDLIHDTIKALYTTFECDNFIQFNYDYNQFKFNFIDNKHMVKLIKYVSLQRENRTKHSAIQELKNRYNDKNIKNIENIEINCVNSHEIEDKNYDFEITMQMKPGMFYIK